MSTLFLKILSTNFKAIFNQMTWITFWDINNTLASKSMVFSPRERYQHYYCQVRFKSLRKHLDYSKVPKLNENDLEEQYVRGSGPGGQATNKTNNAVVLKHKPTGLTIKNHETRSLWINRERARENLVKKLDNLLNGENSIENQERRYYTRLLAQKEKKRQKLAEMKKAYKEKERFK